MTTALVNLEHADGQPNRHTDLALKRPLLAHVKRTAIKAARWIDYEDVTGQGLESTQEESHLHLTQTSSSGNNNRARLPVLFVSCWAIAQTAAVLAHWVYTSGGSAFGLHALFYTVASAYLLRSQPLYACFFALVGNAWAHGVTKADSWYATPDISWLVVCPLFLLMASEWTNLIGRTRRIFYFVGAAIALLPGALMLGSPSGQRVGVTLFLALLSLAFLCLTERSFFLGWRRTLRTSALVAATGVVVALSMLGNVTPIISPPWIWQTAQATMLLSPAGCLLFEWAHQWRQTIDQKAL